MAEDNIKQVSFTATTDENSWVTFSSTQPDGVTVISNHEIKSVKSVKNIRIVCAENPTYKERTDKILFEQDESHKKDDITVTQTAKACDCDAFVITINDTTFAQIGETKQIGTISKKDGNACDLGVFSIENKKTGDSISVDRNNNIVLTLASNTGDSRNITIKYVFNNRECELGEYHITQNGINCNCNSVNVSCVPNVQIIPSTGGTNLNIHVATISYSTGCKQKVSSLTASSPIQGVDVYLSGDNVYIRNVSENTGTTERNIVISISYKVNGNSCTPITLNNCVTQEGQEPIVCDCSSITNVKWNTGTTIPSGGTSNYEVISSFTVSQGCYVSGVSAIVSEGANYATATTTNGKVYLNVDPNESETRRSITVKLKYNDTTCDNILKTFEQEAKVITCGCESITVITAYTATTVDVTGNTSFKAIEYRVTGNNCSVNSVSAISNSQFVTVSCVNDGTHNSGYTNVNVSYNEDVGNRNFTIQLKFNNSTCSSSFTFTQSGCTCNQITAKTVSDIEAIPLNASGPYNVALYDYPQECEPVFSCLTSNDITIYDVDTQSVYQWVNAIKTPCTRFPDYDNMIVVGVDFISDPDSATVEEKNLEMKLQFEDCSTEKSVDFKRIKFHDDMLIMSPLMYEFASEDIVPTPAYPYEEITSGLSTVYAPVGYLLLEPDEETGFVSTVKNVIDHPKFVPFDEPITDFMYDKILTTDKTIRCVPTEIEYNTYLTKKTRASYASKNGEVYYYCYNDEEQYDKLKCNSAKTIYNDSEALISTNQFFYDYGERLIYKLNKSIIHGTDTVHDVSLGDYGYGWDYNGIKQNEPYCENEPNKFFYDYFIENSIESINSKALNNQLIVTNNTYKNNKYGEAKRLYVIYGQGLRFGIERETGQIVKYITAHKYVPNRIKHFKMTVQPAQYLEKASIGAYYPTSTIGIGTKERDNHVDDTWGDSSTEDMVMSGYVGNFGAVDTEYLTSNDIYYYVYDFGGVPYKIFNTFKTNNGNANIVNRFEQFKLNSYKPTKTGGYGFYKASEYQINIGAVDSTITTSVSIMAYMHNNNSYYLLTGLTWLYYETTMWDDNNNHYFSNEIEPIPEGTAVIEISDMPLFITLRDIGFQLNEENAQCDDCQETKKDYERNIFISKNITDLKLICECKEEGTIPTLFVTRVETNIDTNKTPEIWQ